MAPGDPAQLGKREPLVGRRWRSAAAQGPGDAGAGGPEPGSVGAAALDGARGLHGGLGPCGRLRLPPDRSWPRTLLLPSGVGTGRGGVGEQCCFCSAGSRFCPFQGLGHSCARPCLPWVMCQTPSATLGGSRWAGVLSGGAAVPRAPRRRPSRPEGRSTAFPSAENTSGSLSPGPQPANTRIFNLGLSAIMVLFDASLATWPLMRDCAFPRQLRALLVKSRGRAIICRWSPKAGVGSDAANYTPAPRPRAHTSSRGNRPGRGRCDMRCSE